jgi:hypothetical protein
MSNEEQELMSAITQKIQESFSGIQAKVFQNFVTQANKDKEELETLKTAHNSVVKRFHALEQEVLELRKLELSSQDLKCLKAELDRKRIDMDHAQEIMKIKLECEASKKEFTSEIFNKFFRNIDIVRNSMANVPVIVRSSCNGNTSEYTEQKYVNTTDVESKQ